MYQDSHKSNELPRHYKYLEPEHSEFHCPHIKCYEKHHLSLLLMISTLYITKPT